jgi:hypothetical protein
MDWWYVHDLNLDLTEDERVLVFEGVDYQSAVFVASKQLGRHVGMFSSRFSNCQGWLQNSQIAVRFGFRCIAQIGTFDSTEDLEADCQTALHATEQPFPDRYADVEMPDAVWMGSCATAAHLWHLG